MGKKYNTQEEGKEGKGKKRDKKERKREGKGERKREEKGKEKGLGNRGFVGKEIGREEGKWERIRLGGKGED